MSAKAIAAWAVLAFIIWWVLVEPHAADHIITNIGHFIDSAVHGVSVFMDGI